MNLISPLILAVLAGSVSAADLVGIVSPREGVLNLRTGDVEIAGLQDLLAGDRFPREGRCLVRLDGPLSPSRRALLTAAGAAPLAYFPTHFFLTDLRETTPERLRALTFVRGVYEYRAEWKLDRRLAAGPNPQPWATPARQQMAAQGRVAVNVWLFAGTSPEPTLAALRQIPGAAVTSTERVSGAYSIGLTLAAADAAGLTDLADVQFVEEFPEYTGRSNATTRWVVQSNQPGVTPLYAQGITGQGQVVGVIDGWVARTHCAFNDPVNPIGPTHRKILAYNTSFGYDFHGTHVAGTAVGNDGTSGNNRGIAYGAKMVFNTWPDVNEQSNYDRFTLHVSQGARVHTNSWGADWLDDYDGGCRAIDTVQRESEDSLIVFAVSDSSLIRNPENAKNSLAVTASNTTPNENTMCFGGAGPTRDGRRKPEIAAPGCSILSSTGNGGCGTNSASGTSMACPAVAGVAALVRDYFVRGFYPSGVARPADTIPPSGSLVKAMLINSGQDMTAVPDYPNMREGWGRVLADAAVYLDGDARRLLIRDVRNASAESLTTGQSAAFDVSVDAPDQTLRVTMVYADVPAEVNASFAPVNDLDLVVTSPAGDVYRGNNFSGGFSFAGGTADNRNNTEQVHLAGPTPGRWRVQVVGSAVNAQTQGFAIVVTGAVSEAPCIGDFNHDGGADGADVEAFFIAWENGETIADLDENGGVDGGDVETFFEAWEAGC